MQGHRGAILHFLGHPSRGKKAWQYFDDGLLILDRGKTLEAGPSRSLLPRLPKGFPVRRHPDALILPGFVDCHVHYAQTGMIAACGDHLLHWLEKSAFPTERQFRSPSHARSVARLFLTELLRNGTTSAMVFPTSHPQSVDTLFEEAEKSNLRLISGKVLMDRHAPRSLLDGQDHGRRASERLIRRWHGRRRLLYAVTPRFAPTSTARQLEEAGKLIHEYPGVYLQTHLAESAREVAWVRSLFPGSRNYLDVYAKNGLAGPRSVFAHCIHLSQREWRLLAKAGASAALCPTSNLFLGSGLFDLERARGHGVKVGLGSDIGAGTSFSLLQNLNEAYKVARLRGTRLAALEAFYLLTLGGAKATGLDRWIGNFEPGKEADFTVLDLKATPLIAYRMASARTVEEKLFLLMTLGDDRAVRETYILGRLAHRRDSTESHQ